MHDNTPFFHSLVFVYAPNNSSDVTAFGLRISYITDYFKYSELNVLAKHFHTVVFPDPGGPRIKQQCLTSKISLSYITFVTNISSAISK